MNDHIPPAALPTHVLQRSDVQEALKKKDFGSVFYLARKWGGISYSKIALSCDIKPERVGVLARGEGEVTSHAKVLQVADGLRIPGYFLGLLPRPWEKYETKVPITQQQDETALPHASRSHLEPDRLEAGNLPVAVPGGSAREYSAVFSSAVNASEDRSWLDEELQRLERDYDIASSTALLAEAGQLHGSLTRIVQDHRGNDTPFGMQARSSLLMGQLMWDASQRRNGDSAAAFFDEAIRNGQIARDPHVVAQAQLRRSFIPLYASGNMSDALSGSCRAANTAAEVPETRASAILHTSEAYARLGQRENAERALYAAEEIAEEADLDETEWNGRAYRVSGSVYLALGMPKHAGSVLEKAIPLLHGRKKSQAIAVANLALAQARQSQPDEAAAMLHRAIELMELTQAGGALTITAATSRELESWRNEPAVAEAQERLFTLFTS